MVLWLHLHVKWTYLVWSVWAFCIRITKIGWLLTELLVKIKTRSFLQHSVVPIVERNSTTKISTWASDSVRLNVASTQAGHESYHARMQPITRHIQRVQALADISRSALWCHSNETGATDFKSAQQCTTRRHPYHSPSYIRVRAVVWECGEGQTDTDTETAVDTIHFASAKPHVKCNKQQTECISWQWRCFFVPYHFVFIHQSCLIHKQCLSAVLHCGISIVH